MDSLNITNLLYLLKCIAGLILCYVLYKAFPQYPFYWSLVSVVITMAPDSSNKLAYDRITANTLGCAVALALYPIHISPLIMLCAGVALIIIIGTLLQLNTALRSAMAALIIVILNEQEHRNWIVALQRVGCVIAGCLIALGVALVFNTVMHLRHKRVYGTDHPDAPAVKP
ncbi:FUSC family protein [Pedobacter sp. L105]|uniref:FUSC family protein n=1 Tax=Pedobacter sp. L105 TaxID=1641871 RepID=UPI00131D264D|nr:FUSC family protein [Pedobacter sp. L105]